MGLFDKKIHIFGFHQAVEQIFNRNNDTEFFSKFWSSVAGDTCLANCFFPHIIRFTVIAASQCRSFFDDIGNNLRVQRQKRIYEWGLPRNPALLQKNKKRQEKTQKQEREHDGGSRTPQNGRSQKTNSRPLITKLVSTRQAQLGIRNHLPKPTRAHAASTILGPTGPSPPWGESGVRGRYPATTIRRRGRDGDGRECLPPKKRNRQHGRGLGRYAGLGWSCQFCGEHPALPSPPPRSNEFDRKGRPMRQTAKKKLVEAQTSEKSQAPTRGSVWGGGSNTSEADGRTWGKKNRATRKLLWEKRRSRKAAS